MLWPNNRRGGETKERVLGSWRRKRSLFRCAGEHASRPLAQLLIFATAALLPELSIVPQRELTWQGF